jgi:hypothetical protein
LGDLKEQLQAAELPSAGSDAKKCGQTPAIKGPKHVTPGLRLVSWNREPDDPAFGVASKIRGQIKRGKALPA